jgi:hypothetical protein
MELIDVHNKKIRYIYRYHDQVFSLKNYMSWCLPDVASSYMQSVGRSEKMIQSQGSSSIEIQGFPSGEKRGIN